MNKFQPLDAVVIATVKSRYRSWLNNQSSDESLDRWHRITEFARIIQTTEKATIMKGWEKTRLTEGIDFDDRIFEEPDNEEEILLQNAMEELMIEDNTESITEDLEAESIVLVPVEGQKDRKQKTKQKQITDFFQSQK